jgi:hypothetical protein
MALCSTSTGSYGSARHPPPTHPPSLNPKDLYTFLVSKSLPIGPESTVATLELLAIEPVPILG